MSEREVEILNRKLDQVLTILNNNHDTGENGLVAEFSALKRTVTGFIAQYNIDQAIKKSDIKWMSAIFGVLGTIAAFLGKFIISLIFKT